MAKTLQAFLAEHPKGLERVRFVVTNDDRRSIFEAALDIADS
jgi:hypothetical protein